MNTMNVQSWQRRTKLRVWYMRLHESKKRWRGDINSTMWMPVNIWAKHWVRGWPPEYRSLVEEEYPSTMMWLEKKEKLRPGQVCHWMLGYFEEEGKVAWPPSEEELKIKCFWKQNSSPGICATLSLQRKTQKDPTVIVPLRAFMLNLVNPSCLFWKDVRTVW